MGFLRNYLDHLAGAGRPKVEYAVVDELYPNAAGLESHFVGVEPTDLLVIAVSDGRSYSVQVKGATIQDIDDPRLNIAETIATLEVEDMLGERGIAR